MFINIKKIHQKYIFIYLINIVDVAKERERERTKERNIYSLCELCFNLDIISYTYSTSMYNFFDIFYNLLERM
jgi:hypothetical protein